VVNPQQPGFADGARLDNDSLRIQQIQLAGKVKLAILPLYLHSAVGRMQKDIYPAFEDYEHTDLPIPVRIEPFIGRKRYFLPVGPEPVDHLFGKPGERKVWTEIRPRPVDDLCLAKAGSLIWFTFFARILHSGNLRESDPRALHFTAFRGAMGERRRSVGGAA